MPAQLNPTRMNLINLKKTIAMAQKGHGILKKKREVLVIEFLKLLQKSKNDRSTLLVTMQEGYKTVVTASTYVGNFELEEAALYTPEAAPVGIAIKNIMGVRIPEISRSDAAAPQTLNMFALKSSSLAVDDISDSFARVRDMIVDIAQREQGLKRLVLEIDKTKRRVNALEYIVIPNLRSQSRYISMRLEEIDRDMFSALKHVKKKLDRGE